MKLARIRNTKDECFLSYVEDRCKDKHIHKNKHDHIQTHAKHVCNSATTLWNSGKERKEKRMLELSVISHTIRGEGKGYKDVH
jgi:hypothetical protein